MRLRLHFVGAAVPDPTAALRPLCGPLALLKRAPGAFQGQRDFVLRMLAAAFRQMMDRKQLVVANRSVP